MTPILKELRIAQMCSKNEQTLVKETFSINTISGDVIHFHGSPWFGRFNHDNNFNISLILSMVIVGLQGVDPGVVPPGTHHNQFDAVLFLNHLNRGTGFNFNPKIK